MKYFLIILLFAICVFLGFLFSLKFKRRAKFFKSLILLSQKLDVGINFSRERLQNLFTELEEATKKDLAGLHENYIEYLKGEQDLSSTVLFKNISFLKDGEKDIVFMFFKMLGRTDVESQTKEIKNFQIRFEELSNSATIDNKKYGSLSLKMGVILGLISVVILW